MNENRNTEERIKDLELFPQQNPSPVLRLDSECRLVYANPGSRSILKFWGIETGDLAPDQIAAPATHALARNCSHDAEVDIDGVPFLFSFAPIKEAGYVNIYGHDIKFLKEAQRQALEATARESAGSTAMATVNAMGEGVALCHPDGRIKSVNPAFAALTDYSEEELQERNIAELLPEVFEQEQSTVRKVITRVQLKQSANNPQDALTVTTGKGVRKWVIPSLSTTHNPATGASDIILSLRDISPLVQAQAELLENERKYRELVQNANSIIIRITPDCRIIFFNEYAQAFLGYSAEDVMEKSIIGMIIPPTDADGQDVGKMTKEMAAHPEIHGTSDGEVRCKDGRKVWIHWANRAIRDEQGQVREILCVGADITEHKRLEQQALSYRNRLRALADRLTSIEEKARRRVATHLHDTVIQTISLSHIRLGGVLNALENSELQDQCERLKGIRSLLEQGTRECRSLMEDLVPALLYELGLPAALKDFADKQTRLEGTPIKIDAEDFSADLNEAERNLLFQCARELIMNALKYAGKCEITLSLSSSPDHVQLQVRDTGRGFNPNKLDHENRDHSEGGFGLFNIRERLDAVQGTLSIQSAPNKGTVATIQIPSFAN